MEDKWDMEGKKYINDENLLEERGEIEVKMEMENMTGTEDKKYFGRQWEREEKKDIEEERDN